MNLRLLSFLACAVLPLFPQTYEFEMLPSPVVYITSINNAEVIVGEHGGTASFVLHPDGRLQAPIVISGTYRTRFLTINHYGAIGGSATFPKFVRRGFIFDRGNLTFVPGWSEVTGINHAGDFVGLVPRPTGFDDGWVSIGGVQAPVAFPGARYTYPTAIGADGTIVGHFQTDRRNGAFLRGPKGRYVELVFDQIPLADSSPPIPAAINSASGKIVGHVRIPGSGGSSVRRGFVYDYRAHLPVIAAAANEGVALQLRVPVELVNYPGAEETLVTGVNASGTLAGWTESSDGDFIPHGFIARPVASSGISNEWK